MDYDYEEPDVDDVGEPDDANVGDAENPMDLLADEVEPEDGKDEELDEDREGADDMQDTERETEMKSNVRVIENIIITDPSQRLLAPYLTSYERARALAVRATQIQSGETPLVEIPRIDDRFYLVTDSGEIARMELEQKRMPLSVLRERMTTSDGVKVFELWKTSELIWLKQTMPTMSSSAPKKN